MQKKWQQRILTASSLCLLSSTLFASPTHVSVGIYDDTHKSRLGLIAVTHDEGKTWAYPAAPQPADNNNYIVLLNAGCNDHYCITTGYYFNKDNDSPAYLASSSDQGATWNYIATAPTESTFTDFASMSCNQTTCFVAGSYYKNDDYDHRFPLLAVGNNKGDTWTYPTSIIKNLPESNSAVFTQVNCTDKSCVAVGYREDIKNNLVPLIANSVDQGSTWSYPAIKLPSDYIKKARLTSIACHKNICVAGGQYHGKVAGYLPMFMTSSDQGQTWSQATVPATPAIVDAGYYIQKVTCSDSSCIAVGDYGLDAPAPLVLQSEDHGKTWNYPSSIITNLPSDVVASGLDNASCKGNYCVASGSYITGYEMTDKQIPWLAISQDSGTTWTYRTPLPADFAGVGLYAGVSCDDMACIAVGQYYNGKVPVPLINTTYDKGTTWTLKTDISASLKDFYRGAFLDMGTDVDSPLAKFKQNKQFGAKAILAARLGKKSK
jgi:hypothetical protein